MPDAMTTLAEDNEFRFECQSYNSDHRPKRLQLDSEAGGLSKDILFGDPNRQSPSFFLQASPFTIGKITCSADSELTSPISLDCTFEVTPASEGTTDRPVLHCHFTTRGLPDAMRWLARRLEGQVFGNHFESQSQEQEFLARLSTVLQNPSNLSLRKAYHETITNFFETNFSNVTGAELNFVASTTDSVSSVPNGRMLAVYAGGGGINRNIGRVIPEIQFDGELKPHFVTRSYSQPGSGLDITNLPRWKERIFDRTKALRREHAASGTISEWKSSSKDARDVLALLDRFEEALRGDNELLLLTLRSGE